ncbi:hypothetical protein CPB85DRAFT_1322146 [Mucidula mucida]|nr:hypothetical protein CPB85DRAFT_1322146 [Mucidula mucida]
MFPQELLDEIVEWLFDDHPSLMALSCTSQCLRARSQALLFHDLELSPRNRPSRYIPLLEMSPHILNYVRRLRIVAEHITLRNPLPGRPVQEDDSFGRLIHALINVDKIEFEGIHSVTVANSPDLLPIVSSPRVRMLKLWGAFLSNPQYLFHILSYFPSVSSLHVDARLHIKGKPPSLDPGSFHVTEIHMLTVSSPLGVFLSNTVASGWLKHLRRLIFLSYSAETLFIISELIPKLPNLISLTLGRPEYNIGDLQTLEIPVFPLQRIRSLHLSLPGFTSSLTRWWLSHLTQEAAVSLEHLAIIFRYADASAASEMQHSMVAWKDAESDLLRLPRLKSVSMKTYIESRSYIVF